MYYIKSFMPIEDVPSINFSFERPGLFIIGEIRDKLIRVINNNGVLSRQDGMIFRAKERITFFNLTDFTLGKEKNAEAVVQKSIAMSKRIKYQLYNLTNDSPLNEIDAIILFSLGMDYKDIELPIFAESEDDLITRVGIAINNSMASIDLGASGVIVGPKTEEAVLIQQVDNDGTIIKSEIISNKIDRGRYSVFIVENCPLQINRITACSANYVRVEDISVPYATDSKLIYKQLGYPIIESISPNSSVVITNTDDTTSYDLLYDNNDHVLTIYRGEAEISTVLFNGQYPRFTIRAHGLSGKITIEIGALPDFINRDKLWPIPIGLSGYIPNPESMWDMTFDQGRVTYVSKEHILSQKDITFGWVYVK